MSTDIAASTAQLKREDFFLDNLIEDMLEYHWTKGRDGTSYSQNPMHDSSYSNGVLNMISNYYHHSEMGRTVLPEITREIKRYELIKKEGFYEKASSVVGTVFRFIPESIALSGIGYGIFEAITTMAEANDTVPLGEIMGGIFISLGSLGLGYVVSVKKEELIKKILPKPDFTESNIARVLDRNEKIYQKILERK